MTQDPRAVAEQIIESLSGNYVGHNGNFIPEWVKAYTQDIDLIAKALADARRAVWEEAATMTRDMANLHRHFGRYERAASLYAMVDEFEVKRAQAGQEEG